MDLNTTDTHSYCDICGNPGNNSCSRCRQLRYCSKECQKLDWKGGHKQACVDYRPYINQVEVRDSPVHGKGVFAVKDIPKNTRVCFLDFKMKKSLSALLYQDADQLPAQKLQITCGIVNAECFFKAYAWPNPDYDRSIYIYPSMPIESFYSNSQFEIICDGYVLVARNQASDSCPMAIGHLINDGAMLNSPGDELILAPFEKEVAEYKLKSLSLQNVEISEDFWYYTTRDVAAGEELFISYGREYWIYRAMMTQTNPLNRAVMFTLATMDHPDRPYDILMANSFTDKTNRAFLTKLCGFPKDKVDEYKNPKDLCNEILTKMDECWLNGNPIC